MSNTEKHNDGFIENRTFDEIEVGDWASYQHTLSLDDIKLFAVMSGDVNPAVMDEEFAKSDIFHEIVGHGMWSASLISTVLGTQLPGPGTIYLGQTLTFTRPVMPGDTITVTCTVTEKNIANQHVLFDCKAENQRSELVLKGEARVLAPSQKVRRKRPELPKVRMSDPHASFKALIDKTTALDPIPMAVVHPCDRESLLGALDSKQAGLIHPLLIAPEEKLRAVAAAEGFSLDGCEIINVAHSHEAAEVAVRLVNEGKAEAIMKGSLHTDELMSAVVSKSGGLRTARRMSHVFIMNVPTYPKTLFVTDAAINIEPSLEDKIDICQNAIDLAKVLGVETPRVAILSAVETVNSKIRSTLDAAALCKMADRKQIAGGILDGPLAFDNAISKAAAKTKGIVSDVSGEADILLVPDLVSGNILAKQLEYLADAHAAGIVLGTKVPIVLTSRADKAMARMTSCAVAVLMAHAKRKASRA